MFDSLIAMLEYLASTKANPRVLLDFENEKIAILLSPTPLVIEYTQAGISEAIKTLENYFKT